MIVNCRTTLPLLLWIYRYKKYFAITNRRSIEQYQYSENTLKEEYEQILQ